MPFQTDLYMSLNSFTQQQKSNELWHFHLENIKINKKFKKVDTC